MPEQNTNNTDNNAANIPFEITFEKAKYLITMAANQIASQHKIPGPLMVLILRDIANEADLNAKNTSLAYYELVTPEEYAELKKAKEAVDKAMTKVNPQNSSQPTSPTKVTKD